MHASLRCSSFLQWNSPLFCDHKHPQDLAVKTPWGLITTQLNFNAAPAAPAGRRLATSDPLALALARRRHLQQSGGNGRSSVAGATTAATASNGAASPGLSLPANSTIEPDYDADQTQKGPTPTGAPGTFNYLVDAILAVPRTRAMYMRRVRSLMDQFVASGRLQELVTAEYNVIKEEAKRDNAKWGNPGDAERGYR